MVQAAFADQPCKAIANSGEAGVSDSKVSRVPPTMVQRQYMVGRAEVRKVPNLPQYSLLFADVVQ